MEENIPCWRTVYMKLTNEDSQLTIEEVKNELETCRKYLEYGLKAYIPCQRKNMKEVPGGNSSEAFLLLGCKFLDLRRDQLLAMLVNFCLFDCRDVGEILKRQIDVEIRSFLYSLWYFYAQERIFMLRTFMYIIDPVRMNSPELGELYSDFLSSLDWRVIYDSITDHLNQSIPRDIPNVTEFGIDENNFTNDWLTYRDREFSVLFELRIVACNHLTTSLTDITKQLAIIKSLFMKRWTYPVLKSDTVDDQLKEWLWKRASYLAIFHTVQLLSSGWQENIYESNDDVFKEHRALIYWNESCEEYIPVALAFSLIQFHRNKTEKDASQVSQSATNISLTNPPFTRDISQTREGVLQARRDISAMWSPSQSSIVDSEDTWLNTSQDSQDTLPNSSFDLEEVDEFSYEYNSDEDPWKFITFLEMDVFKKRTLFLPIVQNLINEMVTICVKSFGHPIIFNQPSHLELMNVFLDPSGSNAHLLPSFQIVMNYYTLRYPFASYHLLKLFNKLVEFGPKESAEVSVSCFNDFKYCVRKVEPDAFYAVRSNFYRLRKEIQPLKYFPDVAIPLFTTFEDDFKHEVIRFNASIPFWKIMRNYLKTCFYERFPEEIIMRASIEFVKFCKLSIEKTHSASQDILECVDDVLALLGKFPCQERTPLEHEMINACLELVNELFPHTPSHILRWLTGTNTIPNYSNVVKCEDTQFSEGYYNPGMIYRILNHDDATVNDYNTLIAYLDLLKNMVQNDETISTWCVVGGLTFISYMMRRLHEVFNQWGKLDDKVDLIILKCVEIFFTVLDKGVNYVLTTNENDWSDYCLKDTARYPTPFFLAKYCLSFLHYERSNFVLRLISNGQSGFTKKMINFCDWNDNQAKAVVTLYQSTFWIIYNSVVFAEILKDQKCIDGVPDITKQLIQYEHLPTCIVNFVQNVFSREIRLIALKLLIRLSSVKSEWISISFNFSHRKIITVFLNPVYDPKTSYSRKVLLTHFAAECIRHNKVIANILANSTGDVERSMFSLPLAYLQKMINEDDGKNMIFRSMCDAVLDVIHAVWLSQVETWQNTCTRMREFWPAIFAPLMCDINEEFTGYLFIFEIINQELQVANVISEDLKVCLFKFLNSKYFTEWMKYGPMLLEPIERKLIALHPTPNLELKIGNAWLKFAKITAIQLIDFVERPSQFCPTIVNELAVEIVEGVLKTKIQILAELYMIYLCAWKEKSSVTWENEVKRILSIFTVMKVFHPKKMPSHFYTTLYLVGNMVLGYGNYQPADDDPLNLRVLSTCCDIMEFEIKYWLESRDVEYDDHRNMALFSSFFTTLIRSWGPRYSARKVSLLKEKGLLLTLLESSVIAMKEGLLSSSLSSVLKFAVALLQFHPELSDVAELTITYRELRDQLSSAIAIEVNRPHSSLKKNEAYEICSYGFSCLRIIASNSSLSEESYLFAYLPMQNKLIIDIFNNIKTSVEERSLEVYFSMMKYTKFLVLQLKPMYYDCVFAVESIMECFYGMLIQIAKYLIEPAAFCKVLYRVNDEELRIMLDSDDSNNAANTKRLARIRNIYVTLMKLLEYGMSVALPLSYRINEIANVDWFEDWKDARQYCNSYIANQDYCKKFVRVTISFDDLCVISRLVNLQYMAFSNRANNPEAISGKDILRSSSSILVVDSSKNMTIWNICFILSQTISILYNSRRSRRETYALASHLTVIMRDLVKFGKNEMKHNAASNALDRCVENIRRLHWCEGETCSGRITALETRDENIEDDGNKQCELTNCSLANLISFLSHLLENFKKP